MRIGAEPVDRKRAPICIARRLKAARFLQRMAQLHPEPGVARLDAQHAAIGLRRLQPVATVARLIGARHQRGDAVLRCDHAAPTGAAAIRSDSRVVNASIVNIASYTARAGERTDSRNARSSINRVSSAARSAIRAVG